MTMPDLPQIALWLGAGLALGAFYFWMLGRSVAAFGQAEGRRRAIGYVVLRLAVAAGVMTLAALQGTGPLLLTLLGFIVARTVAIRRAKGAE
ncbi:N-ATPase subunit AtpR [Pseudodonghicola flavimaris]|uniref:ATP synthase subunit I n=1 Tax=Pseudodonghicola flavimaris TaxID=3050036 RepID=A0ABT7F6C6_9RHOB|nr:ATP synthase subunit I [Pseudodonghicola flavimaris]MDK3019949.1 ATP synthase subunit I [Pseudodonghicola flavimaris]